MSEGMGGIDYGQGEKTLSQAAEMTLVAMGDFEKLADQLRDEINALQGKWGGSGARAFQILQTAWDEKQLVIVRALNDFADSLGVTEKLNIENDQEIEMQNTGLAAALDATGGYRGPGA